MSRSTKDQVQGYVLYCGLVGKYVKGFRDGAMLGTPTFDTAMVFDNLTDMVTALRSNPAVCLAGQNDLVVRKLLRTTITTTTSITKAVML